MKIQDRQGAQPRIKNVVQAKAVVLPSRSTEKDRGAAADFIVPVDTDFVVFDDFLGDAGDALAAPWTVTSTETGGTPVKDFLANGTGGIFKLAGDTTSEAQTVRLDFGDHLPIDSAKNAVIEVRVQVQFNSTDTEFTADERLVVGLGSAYNATLDDVAKNAWFRIEGASLNLLAEVDDGTTDDDDNDTGIDIVDEAWITLRIDLSDPATVRFYADGALVSELAASAMTGNVQPIIAYQKDAGAEAQVILIDYVKVWCER